MTRIPLKTYQINALDSLKTYLEQARFLGAKAAYDDHEKPGVVNKRAFNSLPASLDNVPYTCLRLPTGGGKTLLAAQTVRIASESYLEREFPLVLWLVPSNTIRSQTLETLKTPGNYNYETLREAFNGNFMVLDITDFTQIRPHDLTSKAVIVLGTIQTIKTEEANTDSRKVYAHNENLEPLFSKIPVGFTGFDTINNGDDQGKIRFSFVNLLRMHRPLVLVDEAHNNATRLGFEVFERVNAACVVEFTATPASNSNVLHSVSAMELKAEEMIKLPIVLTEHKTWPEAVRDSILQRKRLEDLCRKETQYIRPIVLFQAENQGQDTTWQVLKDHLLTNENIPEEKIAVVTGDQRELDGINLFDPNCPIEFIITVQALKEGWDCSFAYVFCSVANIHSAKDVEQILGRVLRMPYAKRRKNEVLNRAYAYVSSVSWPNAATQLQDRLVEKMGFEKEEIDESLETRQPSFDFADDQPYEPFRQPDPIVVTLSQEVDLNDLSDTDKQAIVIAKSDTGEMIATVVSDISAIALEKLVSHVAQGSQAEVRLKLHLHQSATQRAIAPVNRGDKFIIPQLCLFIDGELELPDDEIFLYAADWKLIGPAQLTETEFSLQPDGMTFAIDILDGHVRQSIVAPAEQLNLDFVDIGWTVNELSFWLDKRLRMPDVPQPQMLEFIRRTVVLLEDERKIPLTALSRGRFLLQKVLDSKIRQLRRQAKRRGYQTLLFGPSPKVEVSYNYSFSYEPNAYFPPRQYHGKYDFKKHFYPNIFEMNGEEADCAWAIEMLGDRLQYWVRNIERDPRSFRLQTSTDYFYPDLVALLTDGRILVVEYKGDLYNPHDVGEKDNLGQLWARESQGKGVFLMAWKQDDQGRNVRQQLLAAIKKCT